MEKHEVNLVPKCQVSEVFNMALKNWKIKKNNKTEFDVWNGKLGYYAELKIDMDSPTLNKYWIVREYSDKPFSAVDLATFDCKEEAVKFILNKIGDQYEGVKNKS